MKAIRIHQFGGPEVLQYEDVPEPAPKPGEALLKVEAAGVNFIDTYQRSGAYKIPLPSILGQEGAGTVSAIGTGTTRVKIGDKVAWASILGSYAESQAIAADRLVALPAGVTAKHGAAVMLQGMTAHYLACSTYPLKPGDTCLVHAGAGGVGLLLMQLAKLRGAHVITAVGRRQAETLSKRRRRRTTCQPTAGRSVRTARVAVMGNRSTSSDSAANDVRQSLNCWRGARSGGGAVPDSQAAPSRQIVCSSS